MTEIYTGRIISFSIGFSVDNLKSVKWRRVHQVTPRFMPSTKVPVGYLQGHSHVEGEFTVKGDIEAGQNEATDATALNAVLCLGKIDGTSTTFTFNNFLLVGVSERDFEAEIPTTTYKFLAYKVDRS